MCTFLLRLPPSQQLPSCSCSRSRNKQCKATKKETIENSCYDKNSQTKKQSCIFFLTPIVDISHRDVRAHGRRNQIVTSEAAETSKTMGANAAKIMNHERLRCSSAHSASHPLKQRTYVQHDYHDHYFDPIYSDQEELNPDAPRRGPRGGVVTPFPERLYIMLSEAEKSGFKDIVSWQLMRVWFIFIFLSICRYFRQSKLTSFQLQVNLYDFHRLTTRKDRGAYYHELFLRGRPDLHKRLQRMRVKDTGCKPAASPSTEPDFYQHTSLAAKQMLAVKFSMTIRRPSYRRMPSERT